MNDDYLNGVQGVTIELNYLKGLQDASLDTVEHGSVFVEKIIKKFGEMEDSDYSDGYLKGYNLMLERRKLL